MADRPGRRRTGLATEKGVTAPGVKEELVWLRENGGMGLAAVPAVKGINYFLSARHIVSTAKE